MEKERKIKTLSLVALIVAVLGLTVAFAALSQTLTINGTASVDAAEWDVHFENLKEAETVGDGKVIKAPTLQKNSTYIGDYEISLTKPGDKVTFYFDVVNAGTIDAKFDSWYINGFNMAEVDAGEVSEEEYAKSFFIEADWDGDGETTDEEIKEGFGGIGFNLDVVKEYDTLDIDVGDKKEFLLEWEYNRNATKVPKGNVKIKVNLEIKFAQK